MCISAARTCTFRHVLSSARTSRHCKIQHSVSEHGSAPSAPRAQPMTISKSFTSPLPLDDLQSTASTDSNGDDAPASDITVTTATLSLGVPSTHITVTDVNRLLGRASHPHTGSTALISQLFSLHPFPTTATYNAAIRALSVHPSPFLLHHILSQMRHHWMSLTPTAHHDACVCLVRNGQVEEALEYADSMIDSGEEPQSWLWDMLMHALLLRDEIDEALHIIRFRVGRSTSREMDVHVNAWYALFDAACARLHYDAVKFVWARQVHGNFERVKPSAGQCAAVMRVAARQGDVELMKGAMKVLSGRGSVLGVPHYELLMEACLAAGRLEEAVGVLAAMERAGHHVSRASTRSLLSSLLQEDTRAEKAWVSLEQIKEDATDGEGIPTAVADTLIESVVAHCTNEISKGNPDAAERWLGKAIQYYKQLHLLCPAGPTAHTFNILLAGCAALPDAKPTAMFIASEMVALDVMPNAVTYDMLILICLQVEPDRADDRKQGSKRYYYEDAFRYLQEMQTKAWVPRATTLRKMIEKCAVAKDDRVYVLLAEMQEANYDTGEVRKWLEQTWMNDN